MVNILSATIVFMIFGTVLLFIYATLVQSSAKILGALFPAEPNAASAAITARRIERRCLPATQSMVPLRAAA